MQQAEKAARFRVLHQAPPILVLPNAWDAASARVIEQAGFPAVATTSAGIAFSLGYPDGERIGRDEMVAAVHRITAAVEAPVTADMEAGYGQTPEAVAETARAVLAAGAVGMNIEDTWERDGHRTLAETSLQVERIRAACEAGRAAGVPLVLNARTDVLLYHLGDFDEAVRRLNAYLRAGAACAYPIGVRDPELIARLVRAIEGPVNILAGPGSPAVKDLERLGVQRASYGSALARAALGITRRIAREIAATGANSAFPEDTVPSPEANHLFE
jgi:2-methylisocitrate lyase-like PEP mutase family enzyme